MLLAYVAHNRGLGYCQALNYVGGMLLLLTELREELAFYLLIHLTERCITDFYSKYMTGIRVTQKLFEDVFRATLPKLAAHLETCGLPLSIVTASWAPCARWSTASQVRTTLRACPSSPAMPDASPVCVVSTERTPSLSLFVVCPSLALENLSALFLSRALELYGNRPY